MSFTASIGTPMKYVIAGIVLCSLFACSTALFAQDDLAAMVELEKKVAGEWKKTSTNVVSVTEATTNTEMHNKEILVSGKAVDVCQKKGCWLVVSDGTSQMRVTFKDYGFFVPTDISGEVTLQGVVLAEELSEETAKHYAEESKGEDPDAIEGPQKVITMVATGVVFYSPVQH